MPVKTKFTGILLTYKVLLESSQSRYKKKGPLNLILAAIPLTKSPWNVFSNAIHCISHTSKALWTPFPLILSCTACNQVPLAVRRCFRATSLHSHFQLGKQRDPGDRSWVLVSLLSQLKTNVHVPLLLIICQQARNKLCSNVTHVQMFC
jgi:hypothetical protein